MTISNYKRIKSSITYPSSIGTPFKPWDNTLNTISIISNNVEFYLEVFITIKSIRSIFGNQLVIGLISTLKNNFSRKSFRSIL